jgi:hypothetical protein
MMMKFTHAVATRRLASAGTFFLRGLTGSLLVSVSAGDEAVVLGMISFI